MSDPPVRPAAPPVPAAGPVRAAADPGTWRVVVEVVRLGLRDDRQLSYRTVSGRLEARQPPDVLALHLAWPGQPAPPAAVCHSTSWRLEDADTLVLTYAAVPDTALTGGLPLDQPAVVSSGDALRPAPAQLHAHHIAAHAVRHLAYLARHDPALAAAQRRHADLWDVLQDVAGRTPTATHDFAHELARSLLDGPEQT